MESTINKLLDDYGLKWVWEEKNGRLEIEKLVRSLKEYNEGIRGSVKISSYIMQRSTFDIIDLKRFIDKTGMDERMNEFKEIVNEGKIDIKYEKIKYKIDPAIGYITREIKTNEEKINKIIEGYKIKKIFDPNFNNQNYVYAAVREEVVNILETAVPGLNKFTNELKKSIIKYCQQIK